MTRKKLKSVVDKMGMIYGSTEDCIFRSIQNQGYAFLSSLTFVSPPAPFMGKWIGVNRIIVELKKVRGFKAHVVKPRSGHRRKRNGTTSKV